MRILVTGSVGAGKSTFAQLLSQKLQNFKLINVSNLVIENKLYINKNSKLDTYIVNDDKLMDYFRKNINILDNFIIDHHSFDIFGNNYFDLIICVTCQNSDDYNVKVLRKRLEQRGYSESKILLNLDVELQQVVIQQLRRFKCRVQQIDNESEQLVSFEAHVEFVHKEIEQMLKNNEELGLKRLVEELDEEIEEIGEFEEVEES